MPIVTNLGQAEYAPLEAESDFSPDRWNPVHGFKLQGSGMDSRTVQQPVPARTTTTVRRMIFTSSQMLQFSM